MREEPLSNGLFVHTVEILNSVLELHHKVNIVQFKMFKEEEHSNESAHDMSE